MRLKFVAALVLFVSFALAHSQSLTILTEEDPPYSFSRDGSPTGFAVEVTKEILKRIKSTDAIQIQPWARVYNSVVNEPNIVAFTMSRTKQRENLFQWVGPIIENDWVFIGKKGSTIKISSLEEAKKLKTIGTVREYAWTQYLTDRGFKNLDAITERKRNVLRLNAGRIQAFVSADSSYKSEILENGLNPDDYEVLFTFNTVQMYIAHSKATNKTIVAQWQTALDEIKKDGTFQTLLKKWLLENKLPSKARPAGS